LQELAEHLQIPVVTSLMGIGSISSRSRCFVGTTIIGGGMAASRGADVVLSLGSRFTYTLGYGIEPFWNDSQAMIQVDLDPGMIGRNKPISLGVVGDCKCFLQQMLEEVKAAPRLDRREWLEGLRSVREQGLSLIEKDASRSDVPICARRMIGEIYRFMDEDAYLILDGGEIEAYSLEQIDLHQPRPPLATMISVGMGHLGTAIPYGIGAKLASPDRQVISISGDGAFMFNIQDLETAARLGLSKLIYIVGNNAHGAR
jgi:acetolactate synthase-1/2/3 large subunit